MRQLTVEEILAADIPEGIYFPVMCNMQEQIRKVVDCAQPNGLTKKFIESGCFAFSVLYALATGECQLEQRIERLGKDE